MAREIGAIDGIKYGFKLYGYLLAVFVIGLGISGAGIGLMITGLPNGPNPELDATAATQYEVNWGVTIVGFVITLFGSGVISAGVLGTIYKLITDSLIRARIETLR